LQPIDPKAKREFALWPPRTAGPPANLVEFHRIRTGVLATGVLATGVLATGVLATGGFFLLRGKTLA